MAYYSYSIIDKYIVHAVCEGPLHIGSAAGGQEDILLHPVSGQPFIQGAGIAGAFRADCERKYGNKIAASIFGASRNEMDDNSSRIKVSDGVFDEKTLVMQCRPHVSIDKATGSVNSKNGSGQKFDMEYIGVGSTFSFSVYVFGNASDDASVKVEELLGNLTNGDIRFGAKKSSGAGIVYIAKVNRKRFDLTKQDDLKAWMQEDSLDDSSYDNITTAIRKNSKQTNAYEIFLDGTTENALQVRGIAVNRFGKGETDSMNMTNALDDFIIPGSSLRGTIRSQMEKIAEYLGAQTIIEEAFGVVGETQSDGKAGNLFFEDTIVGDPESNSRMPLRHRIHVDKFTGGVFDKGLFAEKNIAGELEMKFIIQDKNQPEAVLGLLLLSLRDLALHMLNIGNGFATGKGFIDVDEIRVQSGDKTSYMIFDGGEMKIEDDEGVISGAMAALKEVSR